MRKLIALLICLMVPAIVGAEEVQGTRVALNAQAEMLVPNDEVVVVFRIEATGRDASALRHQVDRTSQGVSDQLQHVTGLTRQTMGRRMDVIWRYDDKLKRQLQDGWNLVQTEQVRSSKPDEVPEWLADIEKAGARLDSLDFAVSAKAVARAQDLLRQQAIGEFRQKAAQFAKALGASSFRIVQMQTDQQMPPRPKMNDSIMAMRAESALQPVLNVGESRMSVTVSGEILLPARDFPAQ